MFLLIQHLVDLRTGVVEDLVVIKEFGDASEVVDGRRLNVYATRHALGL